MRRVSMRELRKWKNNEANRYSGGQSGVQFLRKLAPSARRMGGNTAGGIAEPFPGTKDSKGIVRAQPGRFVCGLTNGRFSAATVRFDRRFSFAPSRPRLSR